MNLGRFRPVRMFAHWTNPVSASMPAGFAIGEPRVKEPAGNLARSIWSPTTASTNFCWMIAGRHVEITA